MLGPPNPPPPPPPPQELVEYLLSTVCMCMYLRVSKQSSSFGNSTEKLGIDSVAIVCCLHVCTYMNVVPYL